MGMSRLAYVHDSRDEVCWAQAFVFAYGGPALVAIGFVFQDAGNSKNVGYQPFVCGDEGPQRSRTEPVRSRIWPRFICSSLQIDTRMRSIEGKGRGRLD